MNSFHSGGCGLRVLGNYSRLFIPILLLFFFFSSRRRHTRSDRDWSSDVCSSDLELEHLPQLARGGVVLPEKTPRARDAPYRRLDLVLERLHAGGRDLADDEVAVTIEHEPRQQVRLAEQIGRASCRERV